MRMIDADKCPCRICNVNYCSDNCADYNAWYWKSENSDAKKGQWKLGVYHAACSECGGIVDMDTDDTGFTDPKPPAWKYCPHCGAMMSES